MELDAERPLRPARAEVGQAPLRHEAGQPGEQAEVHRHRRRLRPGRRRAPPPSLAELGYNVTCFCYQDSPRRAHSIAAQGGINAAKNYQNDGDSVYRLFYDTIKGGDFRAREANVYRLAEVSRQHHRPVRRAGRAVRPRVRRHCSPTAPSAAPRSRAPSTPAARPASSSCSAPTRRSSGRSASGTVDDVPAPRDARPGRRRRPRARHRRPRPGDRRDRVARRPTRSSSRPAATATSSTSPTNAKGCNATAIWRAYKKGAAFANPCYTQIHPTCIPVTGDHQSQADADVRVAAQRRPHLGARRRRATRGRRTRSPRTSATTTSSGSTRASATSRPRDIASRAAKEVCDEGRGVGPDRPRRLPRLRRRHQAPRRGHDRASATATSSTCTSASPARTRTRCRCASTPPSHYTMGGLWVDYNLMSTIPGLFVLGEANFSDHGANRLGAQRADAGPGRRLLRPPVHDRQLPRRDEARARSATDHPAFKEAEAAVADARQAAARRSRASAPSTPSTASSGKLMWDYCGMARTAKGLEHGARARSPRCARSSGRTSRVLGDGDELNQSLEKAGRVADFLELGELLCLRRPRARRVLRRPLPRGVPDARTARPQRDDEHFCHVAAWEYTGDGQTPIRTRRAARRSRTSTSRSGATSERQHEPHPARLAPEGRADARASSSPTRPPTSRPTCRSSRCSTSSTRA